MKHYSKNKINELIDNAGRIDFESLLQLRRIIESECVKRNKIMNDFFESEEWTEHML